MTISEMNQSKADALNANVGTLAGFDCPICRNKGYFAVATENGISTKDCECLKARRSKKFIEDSGLGNVLEKYSFEQYLPKESWQKKIKETAEAFCNKKDNNWFLVVGRPGSGKTHICTAICANLLNKNYQVRYMMWRTEALYLKMSISGSGDYTKKMNELCTADVLYIDDFWKGDVTQADINLAFELINYRYMSNGFATIISSEKTLDEILDIDEAIGSRILQRSKGYLLKTADVNLRM